MIRGIYQGGKYITVDGGTPSTPSIYNNYNSGQGSGPQSFAGQVRYNTSTQNMEVFDGNSWVTWASSVASVKLTSDAERLLDWAQKKMFEEMDLEARMEKHPGLKDAYEKFRIMDILTLEEKHDVGEVQTSP
jgi:hypothetical protein